MANKVRSHLNPAVFNKPSKVKEEAEAARKILTPKQIAKQEFGNRLYRLMLNKGWSQSELARRADLPRDLISTYVRGRSFPTPQSAQRLSKALGILPEELMPNHVSSAIEEDNPAFDMKVSPNAPGHAWVKVNQLLRLETAVKIVQLIQEDAALADAK